MTLGLSASGKSTWARRQLELQPDSWKVVCRDDLRRMLDGDVWSHDNEKFVLAARDLLIEAALAAGMSVVVADTNIATMHERTLRRLAAGRADFTVVDFTAVSAQECIDRDKDRVASVGEEVINRQAKQLRKRRPVPVTEPDRFMVDAAGAPIFTPVAQPDDGVPTLLVDLDGVYADPCDRSIYAIDDVEFDGCNPVTHAFVAGFRAQFPDGQVVAITGRMEEARPATQRWASQHGVVFDQLLMRTADDFRPAPIVKFDLWEAHLSRTARVVAALDDDARIVQMWRQCGFAAWQPHPAG
jgi:predicted kinase